MPSTFKEDVIMRERLSIDPLAERAQKMARNLLYMRFGYHDDSNEKALRSAIDGIKAIDHKVRYMDLLRAELLVQFNEHEEDCKESNCRMGQLHAEAVFILQDELAALSPVVAQRNPLDSITAQQSNELIRVKNELLDAIESAQQDSTSAMLILSEQLDELFGKQAYGRKDFFSLIKSRLVEVGVDTILEKGVYEPLLTKVEGILSSGPIDP